MTKYEIRIMIMALLEIEQDDICLDIGAGTGSVSVEAAAQGAKVYAVERRAEGVSLISQNAEKFGVEVEVLHGNAPEDIDETLEFDKVFVGGTGKSLEEIVDWSFEHMKDGGIIAGSFVTLHNLVDFQRALKRAGFLDVDTRLISASRVEGRAELLKAQNPIFIVRGVKR